jgi:LysR family carnitine catabolism transcriptional activator
VIYPSLTKLRTFIAVAQQKSFRKASETLHLSQPALSAHIRDLEKDLHVPLFHRTTRSVVLTSEGERLLIGAQRALDELDSVLMELRDQVALLRGRIVISCLPSVAYSILPPVIAAFAKKHPDVDIRVFDELNASLLQRVMSREADFGIGPRPDEADLQFVPVFRDPFVAVVPLSHPLAGQKNVRLKALAKLPILTLGQGTNVREHLEQVFAEAGLTLKPVYETSHRAALSGMAEAGLGVALLPGMVQSMLHNPSLTTVKIVDPEIVREFGIIQRRDQAHRPAVVAFLSSLEKIAGSMDVSETAPERRRSPTKTRPAKTGPAKA